MKAALALALAVLIALAPCAAPAATNDPAPKATAATDGSTKDTATKDSSTKDSATKSTARQKDCSTIRSTTVRQACFDRQAAEHSGQRSGNMGDAVDKLKREDDMLAKKLKSICRGC
jgi:hypothetical protein